MFRKNLNERDKAKEEFIKKRKLKVIGKVWVFSIALIFFIPFITILCYYGLYYNPSEIMTMKQIWNEPPVKLVSFAMIIMVLICAFIVTIATICNRAKYETAYANEKREQEKEQSRELVDKFLSTKRAVRLIKPDAYGEYFKTIQEGNMAQIFAVLEENTDMVKTFVKHNGEKEIVLDKFSKEYFLFAYELVNED